MSTTASAQRLAGELKSAVSDAEKVMNDDGDKTDEQASEVRSRLAAAIESAKATYQKLEDKSIAAAKATDRTIRGHPYESLAVALGLGVIIGMLVSRSRRD